MSMLFKLDEFLPAVAIQGTYILSGRERELVETYLGPNFLVDGTVTVTKNYDNQRTYILPSNELEAQKYLTSTLTPEFRETAKDILDPKKLLELLEGHASEPCVAPVIEIVSQAATQSYGYYAWNALLKVHEPKYLYFDEYYQLSGADNVQSLKKRVETKKLNPSDQPLLGLIELARLSFDEMLSPGRTQTLKNKLQGASVHLTKQILPFWSQNKHLQIGFDVRPALPGDPEGMKDGINIWGEVLDTRHFASTALGARSRGFVWFFSFVAWYSQIKRKNENVILLLDEPGLTLHGRAQGDLLRYFENQLKPHHQVIYTTHSPFMVDPQNFERVRIVQDLSIEKDNLPREKQGSKVIQDVFAATEDSLFPLQGALGYEIHQSLFIGPNSLLVEGPADLLYIRAMSALLEREGREGLSEKWVLTPVGGASRVPTYVRLLMGQRGMKIATLIDVQENDRATIDGLYKGKLLKQANVRTYADHTGSKEADVEDMFDVDFYLDIVNAEYKTEIPNPIKENDLKNRAPRILVRLEAHFKNVPLTKGVFSHYRPARYFHENLDKISKTLSDSTRDRWERAFSDLNGLL